MRKLLSAVSAARCAKRRTVASHIPHLEQEVDLILLDLNLPDLGGLELLERLRQVSSAAIIVLSMHAEPLYITRAMEAGAQGYTSKAAPPEELLTVIRKVMAGGRYIEAELAQLLAAQSDTAPQFMTQLSSREIELLRARRRTLSAEIASALGLSYKTVANTCSLMKSKLGVRQNG